ncbi:rhamnosyltransferase WsaF family glycosyltransferase [Robbsia andropogonis]|uniref:rhamnosyltransferase WsaF family glycosyltransferase n=1 Tax=Robbsia andropogonis TaxID=28092 RepID=UPI002A6B0CA9|nr:glycosyltransferase [Robbsia andropogonis]
MNKKSLHQLYEEHRGKVSDKWSLYISEYDRLFQPYRDAPINFLEIGIQNGGSLEIWTRYFDGAQNLIGCDINPDCAKLTYEDPRVSVIVGDADDTTVQARVLARAPAFDIIIDDGSHLSSDIVRSFALYFSQLKEGGLFVIEDLHCSYWKVFEGGLYDPYSSWSFFKRLTDVINHEHWGVAAERKQILDGFAREYRCELPEDLLAQVHSVEFINSLCVVRKAPAAANSLGTRIITGTQALVADGMAPLNGAQYKLDPIFDESINPWSTLDTPPDEAYLGLTRKLASAQLDVKSFRDDIARLQQEIANLNAAQREILRSTSWRISAPIRFLGTHARHPARALLGAARFTNRRYKQATGRDLREIVLPGAHAFYRRFLKGTPAGEKLSRYLLTRGLVRGEELQGPGFSRPAAPVVLQFDRAHEALAVEANSHEPYFHYSPPLNTVIDDQLANVSTINVLLPSQQMRHMSGGPNTALLLAALLAERGERVRIINTDVESDGNVNALYRHMDVLLRRPVARERITVVDGFNRAVPMPIGIRDIFIATAWWTAQMAKFAVGQTLHREFIYLIQDFEPILHEGSTFQARALETYGLPHIPIINTKLLKDFFVKESIGRYKDSRFADNALYFEPALDRDHYFPDATTDGGVQKKVLLFYARPTVAKRNLFEIGVVALRQAVAAGVISAEHWDVWAMGEKIEPVDLGNGVSLKPLPWLDFEAYAKRVRTADVLLSLMLSPHPSYPPLEMAASGKLVVTNQYSVKSAKRLKQISPNIIGADATPQAIAAALRFAANRVNLGLPAFDPRGQVSFPTDWDDSFAPILPTLMHQIQALRNLAVDDDMPTDRRAMQSGLPLVPRSDYERFRLDRLARRRLDGPYVQQPGLLSFVTSAYNTAPSFLEALGASVLGQDGGTQFEWFILDNGTTDAASRAALAVLGKHPSVRLMRVEDNLGIIGGMRYCLEQATGRYILPLDSDDLLEPDCVHILTRTLIENDFPALLYTDEDKLSGERFDMPYFKPDWDPVLFLHSCYIAHLCAIDREKALALQLYNDKGSEGCHDWDSFLRFSYAGHVPVHIPEVLYSWRMHEQSTSGNIASKSYITDSHRNTFLRFLASRNLPNIEFVNSPLFAHNVDWWFRRRRENPASLLSIRIGANTAAVAAAPVIKVATLNASEGLAGLARIVSDCDAELIHLMVDGVEPDGDEWAWDAMALLELFPDAVMVGGMVHDGRHVVDGSRVLGYGAGADCPDRGRAIEDPGYGARLWKAHTASALGGWHVVVRASFLRDSVTTLAGENIELAALGLWLSGLAKVQGKRVVSSPFMRAKGSAASLPAVSHDQLAQFLSRFWSCVPDPVSYSERLGLDPAYTYVSVAPEVNQRHLLSLQKKLLPYARWAEATFPQRSARYPVNHPSPSIAVLTTVYERTDMALLDALGDALRAQTLAPSQWIIVAHGPITEAHLAHLREQSAQRWQATLIVEPTPLGIMGAMSRAFDAATSDYVVPVDADDLLTADALQILAHTIAAEKMPALVYSDEDLLVDGEPASPYLRGDFDPILNLESSYIWHLCAIRRDAGKRAGIYTDAGATWCHDWDSVTRIANLEERIVHVPEVLYHWRQHSLSTTNNDTGDSRSLDSVRAVLSAQIALQAHPEHFDVADWPESRGARELYVARHATALPAFVTIDELAKASDEGLDLADDTIVIQADDGLVIDRSSVYVEVARLFELHSQLGALGGLVELPDGTCVDACYVSDAAGDLTTPWRGGRRGPGPWALQLKPQTVVATGDALAFFRLSALKQSCIVPFADDVVPNAGQLCARLIDAGHRVGFSPLVRATCGAHTLLRPARSEIALTASVPRLALSRYGIKQAHR